MRKLRVRRSGVARLFAPDDRLVGARLQQMHAPDPAIEKADLGIARTEPDGLLLGRDQLLDRPGHELAPAEMGVCVGPVAVERDDGLVFGNGLVVSVLRTQHLAFGETRERAARRRGEGSLGQVFRAHNIGRGRAGHKIEDTGRELDRQPALRRDGVLIERQGPLEQGNRLGTVLTRWRLQPCGAPAQNVIPRVRTLDRPGGCGVDQLEVERNRDPVA